MSIDDLYGERSYLRGKISACERKLGDLERQRESVKKDLRDLESDRIKVKTIVDKIDCITPYLRIAKNNTSSAKSFVSSYYNGSQTSGWRGKMQLVWNSTDSVNTSLNSVQKDGNQTIKDIDKEIEKKEGKLKEIESNIETTREERDGYQDDLDDVQYEIDHYYDDDD